MKKRLFVLPLLAAGLLASCGNNDPKPSDVHVEKIELSLDGKTMLEGETQALTYVITPDNATNKNVTWSSTDDNVAKYVDGAIHAYKEGTATITVTTVDGNKSDSCLVEVYSGKEIIHVESVSLSNEDLSLETGKSGTLTYTILPANATNKNVKWVSDDSSIATVDNGVVKAISAGNTVVSVITNDGFKVAKCSVTVSEPVTPPTPEPEETKTSTLNAAKFADSETAPLNTNVDYINFNFEQKTGTYVPGYYTGQGGSFKLYKGNTLTITSSKGNISEINFTYNAKKDTSAMKLNASTGTVSADLLKWAGDAKSIVFTTEDIDGSKCFSTIAVTYTISSHHPAVDLGQKSIAEVKAYIVQAVKDEVFEVNAYGMGVDPYTTVTIKGLAMAKLALVKTTKDYGYNVTEPNKVVIGDSTDAIAVASKTGDGTFYGKVASHQMKETSKYSVTGYISMNLGIPELICTSYSWDQDQKETADISKISKAVITLTDFYNKANEVNYNISGYGYGETYTIKGLTCYYSEADGQGKTWYNFTDGTKNIRVNAYNISRISVGNVYDVTGIISLASYSPIIVAFEFKASTETAVDLTTFYQSASSMNIENLKKINYVNDTTTKYPEMINNYSKIYKTTGYITTVEENGKYYLGISDTYIDTKDFPSGKGNSSTKYNLALIKNNNFWNLDDPYFQYNPYREVTDTDTPVTVYYTPRQSGFYNGKMYWEILLIPQSIPPVVSE